MSKELKVMIEAAKAGGAVLRSYFGTELVIREKTNLRDLCSKADVESEQAILAVLKRDFPAYGIYAEEQGKSNENADRMFVIDPLEATNNFLLGIPYYGVLISLIVDKKLQSAAVYFPASDQLFRAERGEGAFMNDVRIVVNKEERISHATVAYGNGYHMHDAYAAYSETLMSHIKRFLGVWATGLDLCLLAAGRIEASIINHSLLYDYSPGKLIAKEAGAMLTKLNGEPEEDELGSQFIASNGTAVHQEIVKIIKTIKNYESTS